jgi:hypothetical protein
VTPGLQCPTLHFLDNEISKAALEGKPKNVILELKTGDGKLELRLQLKLNAPHVKLI